MTFYLGYFAAFYAGMFFGILALAVVRVAK